MQRSECSWRWWCQSGHSRKVCTLQKQSSERSGVRCSAFQQPYNDHLGAVDDIVTGNCGVRSSSIVSVASASGCAVTAVSFQSVGLDGAVSQSNLHLSGGGVAVDKSQSDSHKRQPHKHSQCRRQKRWWSPRCRTDPNEVVSSLGAVSKVCHVNTGHASSNTVSLAADSDGLSRIALCRLSAGNHGGGIHRGNAASHCVSDSIALGNLAIQNDGVSGVAVINVINAADRSTSCRSNGVGRAVGIGGDAGPGANSVLNCNDLGDLVLAVCINLNRQASASQTSNEVAALVVVAVFLVESYLATTRLPTTPFV